jgi:glycosyltransferase involved in cell wall biosynthesis
MMGDKHEIYVYAPESKKIKGAKMMVNCLYDEARQKVFGKDDANRLPDWPTDEQTASFNENVIRKLRKLMNERDLILLSGGWTHKAISDAFPAHIKVEPFCGYDGILLPQQQVFANGPWVAYESYFHMAQVAAKKGITDIRWYDRVIPPFVDPDEFPHLNNGKGKYLLFVGRLIPRKGPQIALQIAEACKMPLHVAGAGGRMHKGVLIGNGVELQSKKVKIMYHGPVGIAERAKLMAGAKALLAPTLFFEPGGNVAVEAMMCGTPVLSADSGVFSETIRPGISGFHFRTMRHAVDGIKRCADLKPKAIRDFGLQNYSLKAVSQKFDAWFSDLDALWRNGFYEL